MRIVEYKSEFLIALLNGDWPTQLFKLIPCEMQFDAGPHSLSFDSAEQAMILAKLLKNKEKFIPIINAELGYSGKQYCSFKALLEKSVELWNILEVAINTTGIN